MKKASTAPAMEVYDSMMEDMQKVLLYLREPGMSRGEDGEDERSSDEEEEAEEAHHESAFYEQKPRARPKKLIDWMQVAYAAQRFGAAALNSAGPFNDSAVRALWTPAKKVAYREYLAAICIQAMARRWLAWRGFWWWRQNKETEQRDSAARRIQGLGRHKIAWKLTVALMQELFSSGFCIKQGQPYYRNLRTREETNKLPMMLEGNVVESLEEKWSKEHRLKRLGDVTVPKVGYIVQVR
jgi:hypothetical protein